MTAPITKFDLTPVMSHSASYRVGTGEATDFAPSVPFGRRVADLLAHVMATPRRQRVMNELSMMSDRDLADIGLARSDMRRVFDRAFIAERESGRYRL